MNERGVRKKSSVGRADRSRPKRTLPSSVIEPERDKKPSAAVSKRMSRTVGRDNQRELQIRSALHRQGLRFRVHYAGVPGTKRTIDMAFTRMKLAVFFDGCFWHGCPLHATIPKTNRDWWIAKLDANIKRDRNTDDRLRADGWSVLRLWEHVKNEEALRIILDRLEELGHFKRPSNIL